jgi:hypothetical protein
MGAGHTMIGNCVSRTVTVNVQGAEPADVFVA